MVYHVSGHHSIDCELHYIKLENGERWVEVGENFSGQNGYGNKRKED